MSKSPVEFTPSWIATRLLTPDATACDRAIVEAMAQRGIEVVHENGTPISTFFAIERAMVSAARQVITQHSVRCGRALKFIESLDEDDDNWDPDEALEHALEERKP
jgi:hypothetical protein